MQRPLGPRGGLRHLPVFISAPPIHHPPCLLPQSLPPHPQIRPPPCRLTLRPLSASPAARPPGCALHRTQRSHSGAGMELVNCRIVNITQICLKPVTSKLARQADHTPPKRRVLPVSESNGTGHATGAEKATRASRGSRSVPPRRRAFLTPTTPIDGPVRCKNSPFAHKKVLCS